MSRRGFIRLISFLTAGVIAFGIMSWVYYWQNVMAKRHIEASYLRSLESLSVSIESIKTSLNKGIYSNSPQMLGEISGRLSSDASSAKMSLSQLPVTDLNLENTNKFLSQVGNYANSISKRFSDGEELTAEDRENLNKLLGHAESLSNELWGVGSMVSGGHLTFEEVLKHSLEAGNSNPYPGHVSDGFSNVEGLFEDYPSLIYDGPFSEHLSKQSPRMIEGLEEISREEASEIARRVSGSDSLEFANDIEGRMSAYAFSDGRATVTITKNGGLFSQMLKYRQISDKAISTDEAIALAEEYLTSIGMDNMVHTYFELNGGICTINFAGYEIAGGFIPVTVYTDIVKVGVALDDGEIMSYDGRGFITAHHERNHDEPAFSEEDAAEKLSPQLTVQSAKLTVIPSSGEHERLCWEFLCRADNGNQVLVYINAKSGVEEQILLLRISDNGTLVI